MSDLIARKPLLALFSATSAMAVSVSALAQGDGDDIVIVTGTRIERPALESPSPITTIGAIDIQRSGETSLVELLNDVPALVGSVDNDGATFGGIGSTGLNTLNLRNLGSNRTLVLVNGRRHVGGAASTTAVDVNTIPIDLVERIDVLTGGASALYGADAVTGAVNFILKDDFEGVSVRAQGGLTPDHGDAARYMASVVAGTNFADDRGNITFSFEYSHENGIGVADRDFAQPENYASLLDNPDYTGLPGTDPVRKLYYQDATSAFASPEGAVALDVFAGAFGLFNFEGDGDPFDFGEFVTGRSTIGGSFTRRANFPDSLTSDMERFVGNIISHYDFNPNVRGFFEFKFAEVNSERSTSPAFSDLIPIVVADNPFLPDNIRDTAMFFGADHVFISHDLFELGRRGEDNRRRTYRVAAGLETTILPDSFDNLGLDLSFVYGRTEEKIITKNNLVLDRFYAAMDAVIDPDTGQPTCRSNLDPSALPPLIFGSFDPFNPTVTPANYGTTPYFTPGPDSGCEPLNLFGLGNASQAAIDFVNDQSLHEASIEQLVISAVLVGDTGGVFELPAGPVGFAFGVEYRDESSADIPALINTEGLTFGNATFPTIGEFDVFEGFGEISVPILSDQFLAKDLTLDAAVRISDYSTIGSTTTWRAGGHWAPFDDFRFRGTYSIAIRAPNIGELFSPQNQSFFSPDDPCDVDNISNSPNPSLRAANCAAILTPLGVDPATFQGDDILSSNFGGVLGGNPNLIEEKATTWTAGFVYQPGWFEGLTFTADYWRIRMEDGIISPDQQDIVNQCVDLPSIDNEFCSLIERRADGGLNYLEVIPVNVAFFETSGIDYEVNYLFDPADIGLDNIGQFNLRYVGSYLERLDVVSLPGQAPDAERDEADTLLGDDAPVHVGALDFTWFYDQLSINYRWRYRSSVLREESSIIDTAANPTGNASGVSEIPFNPLRSSALSTHDFQLRYDINDDAGVYIGVNNAFNQLPDIGSLRRPVNSIGRYVYAGFNYNFH